MSTDMATPEALHILLIDDHALVRTGLRMMLESAWPDGHVTEAGSIGEATGAAYELGTAELPPQLIMLDIELPGLSGLAGLTVLRKRWPEARVMVLTSHTEAEVREQALVQGADGFLSKAESTPQMLASIQALLQGDKCTAPNLRASPALQLTPRQYEVLDLLCKGLSNKVIALRMNVSENTIRGHVQALLSSLGVASRAEAVIAARARGLVR